VGDHHDGRAQLPVDPLEQGKDVKGGLGVQRAGGLVGEQDPRRGGQRPRDTDPLFLPAGELMGELAGLVGDPDELQQLGHPLPTPLPRPPGDPQRIADIARDSARGEQVELLKDHPDLAAQLPQPTLTQLTGHPPTHRDGARSR